MLALLLCLAHADPTVQRDLPYRGAEGPERARLDLVRPEGAKEPALVVFVHGGGWRGGDKSAAARGVVPAFVSRGVAVASVNYRLVGQGSTTPLDQADDVATAVAWLQTHREELGLGEDLVLLGWSSGAHLVSLVAVDGELRARHGLGEGVIDGVIALDHTAYDVPLAIAEGCERGWCLAKPSMEGAFGTKLEGQRRGSPIHRLPTLDVPPPPFLVVSTPQWGDQRQTLSKAMSARFVEALKAAGGQAEHVHLADESHLSLLPDLGKKGDALTAAVGEFLRPIREAGDKPAPSAEDGEGR